MIRVLLYAGDKSKSLGEYLEGRGTFLVDSSYSTIEESYHYFQDAITDVDKTIYLLRNGVDAKTEMKYLSALLKDSIFFRPGEIVFIAPVGGKCDKAVDYFRTVMQQAGKQDFVIRRVASHLSYADIYSAIMGTSQDNTVSNSRRQLYRVERNSDTSEVFTAKNDLELCIQPFSYDSLTMYKRSQENIVRLNSSVPVTDYQEGDLKKFNDLSFDSIDTKNPELEINKVIVSGREKSGMSIWTAALASSAQADSDRRVCVLDFTVNGDIPMTFDKYGVGYSKVTMAELLQGKQPDVSAITVCQPRNDAENDVLLGFLDHLLYKKDTAHTDYILVTPITSVKEVAQLVQPKVVVLTAVPLLNDLRALQEYSNLSEYTNLIIALNEVMGEYARDDFMGQEDIKTLFLDKVSLVKSIKFKDLAVGSSMYNKLIGGDARG